MLVLAGTLSWSSTLFRFVAPSISLAMLGATGVLLVWDLKRPERFLYIFTKPNPTSWLFWGSVALAAYGAISGGWLAAAVSGAAGWASRATVASALSILKLAAAPAAAITAGYTGLLFNQAEGRDLWQSATLTPHLVVQAALAGSGLLLATAASGTPPSLRRFLTRTFVAAAGAHLGMLGLEYGPSRRTKQARAAVGLVTRGRYARQFWAGAVSLPAVAALLAAGSRRGQRARLGVVAGILAQVGLCIYESVFIRAGQDVPLS
jgi:Ni/Fe-hydrogenase subunit HybB-like protein